MFALRRILFVVFDQFELLDLSGPSSVFNAAQALLKHSAYSIHTLSSVGGLICSRTGIEINSQTFEGISVCSSDTILIVGGARQAINKASIDPSLHVWLANNVAKAERVGSICSGALVLAANGLLDGKKATTHWADLDQLVRDYPSVDVEQDALYCEDNNTWTSAGVTTGIDMALAMVGKDHNRKVMQEIASWLVVYAHRPGHQSQFSELLAAQNHHMFSDIVVWLDRNLHKPLKVRDMAEKSAMTERTFYRRFTDEVGCTPSKFLENRRLFRAKQLLETGSVVKSVNTSVGYKSVLGLYKRMHCK
jgi:transcriptional regulator GlxA family with amidase domain